MEYVGKANFSKCKKYRYFLERILDNEPKQKALLIIGLNPSTADARKNDPTISRCINFAKTWGYNRLWVCNLFAFRSTDPAGLLTQTDPIGGLNDKWIARLNDKATMTLVAWGIHGSLADRDKDVLKIVKKPMCLGTTKDGLPRHPLYVKSDVVPIDYTSR